MWFPSSPFVDLREILNSRPLWIYKPEVKTTASVRMICNRNMLLPVPKPVVKNLAAQRSPVHSTHQLPVIQQTDYPGATSVFETS